MGSTQFGVQEKMLKHQHESQIKMLEAEKIRAIAQMTTQYDQQHMQQKLAIEQAYKQQTSQLDGEDPARNGHPAAGRADDGPGQAVRDAGGDAEADGERVRQRVRGRGRSPR